MHSSANTALPGGPTPQKCWLAQGALGAMLCLAPLPPALPCPPGCLALSSMMSLVRVSGSYLRTPRTCWLCSGWKIS